MPYQWGTSAIRNAACCISERVHHVDPHFFVKTIMILANQSNVSTMPRCNTGIGEWGLNIYHDTSLGVALL
jgi:hypothetical protein